MIPTQNRALAAPTHDLAPPSPIRPLRSYFFFLLIMIYLATMISEGPLRYLLFNLYLEEFLYIRELIPIIIILFVIGAAKAKVTIGNWKKSGIEMAVVGTLAALVGYLVGSLLGAVYA